MLRIKTIMIRTVGSLFVFTALAFSIYRMLRWMEVERLLNPNYILTQIIQTGPVKEALPTVLLAELIDLSVDHPTNYYALDEKKAEAKLLNCPVIARASVKKIKPNTVYIDYELRRPVALYADFENMAIDEQRRLFPLIPYFTPKQLPEIVLGEHRFHEMVTGEKIELAFQVLEMLVLAKIQEHAIIKRIDVSKAFSASYGKREIVVVLEQKSERHYLRLTQKSLASGVANYLSLIEGLDPVSTTRVIDLRIEKLAYIEDIAF